MARFEWSKYTLVGQSYLVNNATSWEGGGKGTLFFHPLSFLVSSLFISWRWNGRDKKTGSRAGLLEINASLFVVVRLIIIHF